MSALSCSLAIGALVCEPQLNRTLYTVEGTDDPIAPGQVLLAPADACRRRDRSTWYYAFPADLEILTLASHMRPQI